MKQNADRIELQELLQFGFNFQNALNASLADGKITGGDTPNLFPLIRSVGPAFNNLGNPIERYKRLPAGEREKLHSWAKERFDLADDVLEILIEDTFRELEGDIRVAMRWKKYLNKAG